MGGKAFIRGLPRGGTSPERDDAIVAAVARGEYAPLNWVEVPIAFGSVDDASIFVMRDALMLGEPGDYVRVSMNADTAQRVAWQLGAFLPTTKICDAVWDAAQIKISPCTQGPPRYSYNDMDLPERMIDYHEQVDAKIRALTSIGAPFVGNVGKHWVLTNKNIGSNRVRNYGWYVDRGWSVSASGRRMIQSLGAAHNSRHVDYSQVLRLVKNEVMIGTKSYTFDEVATDPQLAHFVSDEGVLKSLYIPSAAPWKVEGAQKYEEPDDETPPNEPDEQRPHSRELVANRLLYRGCAPGNDVGDWQKFVGVRTDNKFGPVTEGATKEFQRSADLVVDGVVGPKTLRAANQSLANAGALEDDIASTLFDIGAVKFLQAKNFTWAARKPGDLKWIVIHSMESDEKPTVAEAVAAWFAGPNAPRASAHFNVDNDSIVQSVKCEHVAWHAPGANRYGIGIEHAGRARQSSEDWEDEFSQAMVETKSIPLCAYLCKKWGIPAVFVNAADLVAGKPGITTHHEVSQAFHKSTHWDPGPGFPMEGYIAAVERILELA